MAATGSATIRRLILPSALLVLLAGLGAAVSFATYVLLAVGLMVLLTESGLMDDDLVIESDEEDE